VDVGANIGFYALMAAARVGPEGRVFAFEPAHGTCELLRKSAKANALENIEVFECAASDRVGMVGYESDDSNGRISHEDRESMAIQVESRTLDRALGSVGRLDVLKIDVEGAEARVIRGGKGVISRWRPVIFTEFCPFGLRLASASEPEAYLEQLRSLDYELSIIRDAGGVTRPVGNAEILAAVPGSGPEHHIDLLATPSSRERDGGRQDQPQQTEFT
jgi:FkbM family methyltransferase